ncbi:MAG: hypothetical protein NFCOHLIN_01656 [Gammaproteobacteria bacterium]|nr:hypothetical protein [Gammaproteobacteria bacterium]
MSPGIILGILLTAMSMAPAARAQQDDATAPGAAPATEAGTAEGDGVPAAGEPAAAGEGQSLPPISAAETLLWLGDQLKGVARPATLKYEFRKAGSLEEGFTDRVHLHVTELLPEGMKKATVDFFTGQRHLSIPPYEAINGNVLLAIFLQGDILEMKRLTEGGTRYFQQRIKFALATKATIADTEIEFEGRKLPAKQVTITPYVDDPKAEINEKFRRLKDKAYTFTVSEQIPGYLYEIHTLVPAPADSAPGSVPVLEEYLRLTSVGPLELTSAATR